MWQRLRRAARWLMAAGALTAFVLVFSSGKPGGGGAALAAPSALTVVKAGPQALLKDLDPLEHRLADGRLVSPLPHGRRAVLTLEPDLQAHLEGVLQRYEVPYGAVAALDPKSGRVLAYVSHSSANPDAGDLVRDATPPAASVFKMVTAAALLDHGVGADSRVCYSGGFRKLYARDLEDDRSRDRQCATLAEAMGGSINTVFAKLADRNLGRADLKRYAAAFGFGHALPFDVPTDASPSEIPGERLELARTAAGFWHNHMSPLHAALMAATVANGGLMPRAGVVREVRGADGKLLYSREPEVFRSVIPASTARVLTEMMRRTVSHGTAHSAFFDPAGNAFLPGISVAGKTGSLSTERPYRAYSWWVGFAPAEAPEIAVAALVVNSPKWRIKGSYLAREALRQHLVVAPAERALAERQRAAREKAAAEAAAADAVAAGANAPAQ